MRRYFTVIGCIAGVGLLVVLALTHRLPATDPVAVTFERQHVAESQGLSRLLFTITNISAEEVRWSGGIETSQGGLYVGHRGILAVGGVYQYSTLARSDSTVAFRAIVHCYGKPSGLARLWMRLCNYEPMIRYVWTPPWAATQVNQVYSEWYFSGIGDDASVIVEDDAADSEAASDRLEESED